MDSFLKRGLRKIGRITVRTTSALRSPLKAGVIGIGNIAPDHIESYEGSGISRAVAVSDVRPSALAQALDRWPSLRAYRDYRQMLGEARPDVVSICTWPQSHAEMVEAAAAAGVRGILCEKPLALQMSDIERMREACARGGVKLAGGHQYRFHGLFTAAARLVRSGALGDVEVVRGNIASTLANNGPHLVDTVRFILGDVPARSVSCRCHRERGEFNRGLPMEDGAEGEILFEGGLRFELRTGDLSPDFFTIRVEGRRGTLVVTPGSLKVEGEVRPPRIPTDPNPRPAQFREFLRWVKGQRPDYPADFEQGARTAELVLALYESSRLGRPVELPLENRGDIVRQLYPSWEDEAPEEVDPPPGPPRFESGERLAMDGGRRAVGAWFSGAASFGAPELANLTRVIASGNLSCTGGRMVPALEREFAGYYGSPHAVASTSGTAAIHVALGALDLEPGDEVITTPLTDMGSIIPILMCNCLPVFADVDPTTGILTAESIARRITPRTRAVILVHLFGRPANLGAIAELLRGRGISLIEDCAQAHGAEYRGRRVGTFGDFGCFSLQQSKQITCGDGGITLVNREDLAERAALFVDKGWDRTKGVRSHLFLGMNYRMTELQGAVALAQLHRLPRMIAARRAGAEDLTERLRGVAGVVPPPDQEGVDPSWWIYAFRTQEESPGLPAGAFAGALRAEGVKVRREYLPVPIFEYDVLREQRTYGRSRYPFSEFPYEVPTSADYPGFHEFNRNLLLMTWSHHVRKRHTASIADAIRKVAAVKSDPAPIHRSEATVG